MKKLNLTILLTWLMSMVVTNAYAYEFVEDGIYYDWDFSSGSTGLEVTYISYDPSEGVETNYSGNIVIPSTVKYYGRDYPVTSIGDNAFYNCNDLESITIPSSVKRIGDAAFSCDNTDAPILSINISSIKDWCEITTDGIGRPYRLYLNGDMVTELNIPSGITSIKDKAFTNCCNITSIIIPEGVTSIGDYAFAFAYGGMSCSVTIPNSLVSIGYYAFTGIYCDAIYISDLSAWCNISDNYSGLQSYSYSLFLNEVEITNLIIPNDVSSIRRNAFEHCTSLTSVTIPNSVTTIGPSAFYDCYSLTSITIPNSVTSIGDNAFFNCSGLAEITIPNSVTSIGGYVFCGCYGLTSITIPNSVTNIGGGVFLDCSRLTSVTIGNSVTTIGDQAFSRCSSLTTITIPNSVKSIGDAAFYSCSRLTSVTIGSSVTTIGHSAFYDCSSLTSITIPNSVTSIGYDAFNGCSGLTSVTIPNSVTSIGYGAFSRCSGLTSITIPNSVTSIGDYAFDGVDLTTVVSLIENPFVIEGMSSSSRAFSVNTFYNATLYVPVGTIDKYKATNGWKDFAYIVEGDPTGIKNIETEQLEEVSYYGLDGKRIETPKSGSVVIKKAGQKTMKVLVK